MNFNDHQIDREKLEVFAEKHNFALNRNDKASHNLIGDTYYDLQLSIPAKDGITEIILYSKDFKIPIETKEMSVKELEDQLGHKIKIVKEN